MANNKLTNKKALEWVLKNTAMPADVREKLENMAASLDRKSSSATHKPTKAQEENAALRDRIMEFLEEHPNLLVTCSDIGKKVPELEGMTTQKISPLMRVLEAEGKVTKLVEKGKSLYQLAKEEEGE